LSTLANKSDIETIERFYDLLDTFGHNPFCAQKLDSSVNSLYAKDEQADNQIQVMTIHRAKGLEWDHVFIAGCHGAARADDKRLLAFDLVTLENGTILPVLAPNLINNTDNLLFDFIHCFNQQKKSYESQRLAYVGLTRAKQSTFLSGYVNISEVEGNIVNPINIEHRKGSLFDMVSSGIPKNTMIQYAQSTQCDSDTRPKRTLLDNVDFRAFSQGNLLAEFRGIQDINNDVIPAFDAQSDWQRIVGTVVHQILRAFAQVGWQAYSSIELIENRQKWRLMLKQAGLANRYTTLAINKLHHHINQVLQDLNCQWLFSKDHLNAQNEMEISFMDAGKLRQYVIDRTFVCSGYRYIINYKTAEPGADEPIESFITRQLNLHEKQMRSYCQLMKKIDTTPIKVALYFTHLRLLKTYDDTFALAA
jgi:ATP-dependent helicase/nuclease subunit A